MKVAVVGLGFMGATHVRAWRKIPGVTVAAVVTRNPLKQAGGNLGGPEPLDLAGARVYKSIDECLRDRELDAVDLCVPTDLHEECAIAALRAGKHVLVEKPLALDGASADRMLSEAALSGRVFMCAQVLRFYPSYREAAHALPSIGFVRAAMFRRRCGVPAWSEWLRDPRRSGGGVFDLLIHDVDFAVKLFGRPESVAATGIAAEGIDWTTAEFRFARTGPVIVEGGWYAPPDYPFTAEFTILGENGTLDYSSAGRPLRNFPGGAIEVSEADGFELELAYFAECVSAGRQPDRCPPADSALAVRLMRTMLDSRARGGERISCLKLG